MQLRQKLAYMALGGVLVLAGHALPGLVVGSATAQGGLQDAEFNEVTVRGLTVVDWATGKKVVRMTSLRGGLFELNQPDGKGAVFIAATPGGGLVGVSQPGGGPNVAVMRAYPTGGGVDVHQPDGTRAASMFAVPDGGAVSVHQPDGTGTVEMAATPTGGQIVIGSKSGDPLVLIGVDENGDGYVTP